MSAKKNRPEEGQDQAPEYSELYHIRSLMRFHRALGIDTYPRNADLDRFMAQGRSEVGAVPKSKQRSGHADPAAPAEDGSALLEGLQQEIFSCTNCRLAANRLGSIPGQGEAGCRLMVVGDWSAQVGPFRDSVLFGPDEDLMLWKMMAAIGLGPDEVYVSNCIKCCPGTGSPPDSECMQSCFSFLSREITAVRPAVIFAMGEVAARMLTGSREMLVRLRGKLAAYRYDPSVPARVMPTFHPRFLLHNPEMKKATWKDLQAVKHRLAEPSP